MKPSLIRSSSILWLRIDLHGLGLIIMKLKKRVFDLISAIIDVARIGFYV